ncbi:hypothetical protein QBC43DRAFT_290120 [Cladorrhinum sp. PSN259]|nr:hypothetical protein QBC43DRAFT_290120 [Cladorrhinum sp. PSN259]
MSRNIRQKYPARGGPRIKLTTKKRRNSDTSSSSSLNLSDDEGYSGVEDVSESDDDDDEHVFAAEEEFIRADKHKVPSQPARPLEEENDADEEDEEDEDDEDDMNGLENDEDDQNEDDDDESIEWPGPDPHIFDIPGGMFSRLENQDEDITPVAQQRHVRFAGIPDSDSDSTSTDTDDDTKFFPDIFVEQGYLDRAFRREIERNDDNLSDSDGSFWDFHNASHDGGLLDSDNEFIAGDDDVVPTVTPRASPPPVNLLAANLLKRSAESDSDSDLDGYETDEEGDTTDEDIPEPLPRKKLVTVREELTSDSDTSVRHVKGKPRVARFKLQRPDNKPIGVFDPTKKKIIIFTPQRQNRIELSPESFNLDLNAHDVNACSPIMDNSAYIMMGSMFSTNTFGDIMNMPGMPFAPAEAFFPVTSDALTGDESDVSEYYPLVEEDDDEATIDLETFIDFKNNRSGCEEESGDEIPWNDDDPESSPTRPKTAASFASAATDITSAGAQPLLSHLFDSNSNAVGAFRKNQLNQQLINSEIATQESLAFSGPYYHGTLRGIKSGSMETVTTPITPVRRQKSNSLVGLNGFPDASPGSPLNHVSQKRKAASNDHADSGMHKRHRSLQDMEILQI